MFIKSLNMNKKVTLGAVSAKGMQNLGRDMAERQTTSEFNQLKMNLPNECGEYVMS